MEMTSNKRRHLRISSPAQSSLVNPHLFASLLVLLFCTAFAAAAEVNFRNCLASNIVNSSPRVLQFVPLHVHATFDTSSSDHDLNVTIFGNVTGRMYDQPLPPPDDPAWSNPNDTFGKIPDLDEANNRYTTLFARYDFLSYTPWNAAPSRFCDSVDRGQCPLSPSFYANASDVNQLSAFSVAHGLFSSYAFGSIQATLRVQSGDADGNYLSCVTATITPDFGGTLKDILRYLPLAILISVGIATITAAVFSPWGSSDLFNWSSNFGRDEDLLRLVTPGFGDCLQYIQFVILTGSLSLNYPGFYQPAVSRVGWSSLLFNESFVSGGNGTQSLVDGVYQYRNDTRYGLDRMSQLVGMTSDRDIWADMIVWLVVIMAAVTVLAQLGFVGRYLYRHFSNVPAEDLRSKNIPFTIGDLVRVAFNYFLLPLTSLSFYQLVIASRGPAYSVALAAVCLVLVLLFAIRLIFLFTRTRPRSFLFDDLLTLLAYGPLYNTYCDDAATFALVPILVNFMRGIAIGAVQQSGVAQVVLLAICEIVLILTINAFRPYPSATSMNIYHTCFSVIRLITILLSIAFVPSLNVESSSRGWIGYAILIIHACTLVFGFFLNAIQTLIEVIARLAGAGGREQDTGGATRGGLTKVFGMRQLSRRMPRREHPRHSMSSNAAMMSTMENEQKQLQLANTRSRSFSAASGQLLDGTRNSNRISQNLDSRTMSTNSPVGPSTPTKRLTQRLSGAGSLGAIVGLHKSTEARDPYYRPPRRNTIDALGEADPRPQMSLGGGKRTEHGSDDDPGEGASTPMRALENDDFEDAPNDRNGPKTDYAVREVDFYYGVRGAALSSGTRKLKTGPADPTGPVSTARGWFKGVLGGKTKEKNKGFEVVRSARAPPPGLFPPPPIPESQETEAYHDENEDTQAAGTLRDRTSSRIASPVPPVRHSQRQSLYDDVSVDEDSDEEPPNNHVAQEPPSLPLIDSVGAIELPSRIGSEASRKSKKRPPPGDIPDVPMVPAIPRKSSRRQSAGDSGGRPRMSGAGPSAYAYHSSPYNKSASQNLGVNRIPFASAQTTLGHNKRYSTGAESTNSSVLRDGDENVAVQSHATDLRDAGGALGAHGADVLEDRPSTMGFVQQHRASDHIHYSPDSAGFEGSAAEIYGRPAQ